MSAMRCETPDMVATARGTRNRAHARNRCHQHPLRLRLTRSSVFPEIWKKRKKKPRSPPLQAPPSTFAMWPFTGRVKREKAPQGRGGFTQADAREGRGMTAREKKRDVTNRLVPHMEKHSVLITMIWPAERLFEGFLVCKEVRGLLRAARPWHFLTLHVKEKTGQGGAGGSGGAARSGPSEWTLHKLLPILGHAEIVLDSYARIPSVLEQINKAERDSLEECQKHKAAGNGNECKSWGCFRTLTLTPEAYVGALPDPMDPHAPSPAHTAPDIAAGQGGTGENADSGPRTVGRNRFELVIRVAERSSDTTPTDVLNEMMRRHLLRELNGLTLFRSKLEDKGALVVAKALVWPVPLSSSRPMTIVSMHVPAHTHSLAYTHAHAHTTAPS